jgi:general secretion pathway protein A
MSHNPSASCQSYFGLSEAPFSIAPDPRYLYMSESHQEALATLLFGLGGNGGFVLLTGDVGAGKTTICRCLLEQVPAACEVAYIFNPKLTVVELLSTICDEFGIAYPAETTSIKLFVDLINAYLLDAHAKDRRAVLIIDEAQNLSAEVLEQIRLLTNLETSQRKLLQIILLGQPELAAMLDRPELRQLAQRIIARYHLGPLTRAEVKSYVRHRLEVSGAMRQLIPRSLMGTVYSLSGGVPRVINTLCERALLGAYVQGKDRVDRATLRQAACEVLPQRIAPPRKRNVPLVFKAGFIVAAGSALLAVAALYQQNQLQRTVEAVQGSIAGLAGPAAFGGEK